RLHCSQRPRRGNGRGSHRTPEKEQGLLFPHLDARALHVCLWGKAGFPERSVPAQRRQQGRDGESPGTGFSGDHAERQKRDVVQRTPPVAMRNLKKAEDAGIPVAMGTDTGPAYRFQGYFEHLELEHMTKAGLTPMQALVSATATAARALRMQQ